MDNAIFLDGFAAEPHARCVYCHAPIESQSKAVLRWRAAVVRERDLSSVPAASLAHEGITCVMCHVRDGGVPVAQIDTGELRYREPRERQGAPANPVVWRQLHRRPGLEVARGRRNSARRFSDTVAGVWQDGWPIKPKDEAERRQERDRNRNMTANKNEGVAITVKWFEIDQVHQKHAAAEELSAGTGGRLFIANVTGGCLYKLVTDAGVTMTFAQYAPPELVRHK